MMRNLMTFACKWMNKNSLWRLWMEIFTFSCCCERIVRIWDTENNELCYTIQAGQALIFDIRWISEEVFATCTAGHSVQLYNVTTTRVVKEQAHQVILWKFCVFLYSSQSSGIFFVKFTVVLDTSARGATWKAEFPLWELQIQVKDWIKYLL